jgi:uncharacterized coiled-coil DUF342 family protein
MIDRDELHDLINDIYSYLDDEGVGAPLVGRDKLQEHITTVYAALDAAHKENDSFRKANKELGAVNEDQFNAIAHLKKQNAANKEGESLRNTAKITIDQCLTQSAEIEKLRDENDNLHDEIASLTGDCDSLQQDLDNGQAIQTELKTKLFTARHALVDALKDTQL